MRFIPPVASFESKRKLDLRHCWWTLALAYCASGAFEFVDNLLELRQLNFERSAPVFFKVAKEATILWLIVRLIRRKGWVRLPSFDLATWAVVTLCMLAVLLAPPIHSWAQAGLVYYIASICLLLLACTFYSKDASEDFAHHFLLPVVLMTFITQLLEVFFTPGSLYKETNLFGFDRRAGIAVIPTTAGILGVYCSMALRGFPRMLSLAVVGIANSSISLICLAIIWIHQNKRSRYFIFILPFMIATFAIAIYSRIGLQASVMTRLDILSHTLEQIVLIGPSPVGALATAKSVSLAPFESYIADSMYLETLHVFGLLPGTVLLVAVFTAIYKRIGGIAALIFAIAGIGFLAAEAWVIWVTIFFTQSRVSKQS